MRLLAASALAGLVAVGCGGGTALAAPKLNVLFSFKYVRGAYPAGALIADSAGNLYGTAEQGGAYGKGVVFELSPPTAGRTKWTETVLLSFEKHGGELLDGGLHVDGAGNLYGAALTGGAHYYGVVFELSPPVAGQTLWTETILHFFKGVDGSGPVGSLISDGAGNLYGTTVGGGPSGNGVVFELSPPTGSHTWWRETVLHAFNGTKGASCLAGLIADGAGNLYGVTQGGGKHGDGVVFELNPPTTGQTSWRETVLHAFNGAKGERPVGGVIADRAGNLYGTTFMGRAHNYGVVFELSPPVAGQTRWTETVLHTFNGAKGENSFAGLIIDGIGNLYGTTEFGGANNDGAVFELSPPAAGQAAWTETMLHSFDGRKGSRPLAGMITDGAGNLYGTTNEGGAEGDGVAFELTP